MLFKSTICFSFAAVAVASPAYSRLRSRNFGEFSGGESCSAPEGSGMCQSTSECMGFSVAGYCPGAADIQCCVQSSCSTPSGDGSCSNTGGGCSGGSFVPGYCPGDDSIQCCVAGASEGTPTPEEPAPEEPPSGSPESPSESPDQTAPPTGSSGSGSGSGSPVVDSAVSQTGLPYVWGGGGCNGPTGGGFDCSGLTQYAICQTQNGKTIPRTANTQYASEMGTHIPRAQAQPGDMLFWGQNGDCGNVKHVGIFMRDGWMVNAARTGTPVREQAIWESSGSLSICPDAVRFW